MASKFVGLHWARPTKTPTNKGMQLEGAPRGPFPFAGVCRRMKRQRYFFQGRRDVVVPVLLEVTSFDELGRPRECVVRYDEETLDLAKSPWKDGVRRFWIVFMGEKDVAKQPTAKA